MGVKFLCVLFNTSKQAYYKRDDNFWKRMALEIFAIKFVEEIRAEDHGIGGKKLLIRLKIFRPPGLISYGLAISHIFLYSGIMMRRYFVIYHCLLMLIAEKLLVGMWVKA